MVTAITAAWRKTEEQITTGWPRTPSLRLGAHNEYHSATSEHTHTKRHKHIFIFISSKSSQRVIVAELDFTNMT